MKWLVPIFALCFSSILCAQNQGAIDSLESVLAKTTNDHLKAYILSQLSDELAEYDLERAKSYNDQLFELAEKSQDDYIASESYAASGYYHYYSRDFEKAAIDVKKAVEYAVESGNPTAMTKAYFRLGSIYKAMGRKDSTLFYLDKAIELSKNNADYVRYARIHLEKGYYYFEQSRLEEALKNYHIADSVLSKIDPKSTDLIAVLNALCGIHRTIKEYDKAEEYCQRAKAISEELGRMAYLMTAERGLGEIDWSRKDYKSAEERFNKVFDYFASMDNKFAECRMLRLLGKVNTDLGEFEKAESNLLKGLDIAREIQDPTTIILIGEDLGYLYLVSENYTQSLHHFMETLDLSRELSSLEHEVKSLKNLAEINYLIQNYQAASAYFKEYVPLQDSLVNTINFEKVAELETRYQTTQKEQQIELLSTENLLGEQKRKNQFTIFASLVGLLLIVGLALVFAYRNKLKTSRKIRELNRVKSRFFANISHEFRTPLTLIKSPLQHLMTQIGDESQQKQLSLIDRNADRMLELVNQLLELSKIDSGKFQFDLREGEIGPFLQSISEPFEYRAEEKGLRFSSSIEIPEGTYRYDKDVVEKIVTNLLSNAVKYTPEHHDMSFRSTIENKTLIINVSNAGSNLENDDLPKLFERFHQTDRQNQGFGIGLALIKELVDLSDGKIEATVKEGVLSFSVFLPLAQVEAENRAIQKEEQEIEEILQEEQETNDEQPVLLIVDDSAEIRSIVKDLFSENYTVLEAEDGLSALKIAQKEIPDCIISDVMMPGMDGLEFAKAIKESELTSFIPVILLTAKSADEDRLDALQNKVDAFLTKPFYNDILKESVYQLIKERKRLQQCYNKELILKPVDIAINSVDEKFLEKLTVIMGEQLHNTGFSTDDFASELGMSRMQLHRKLKSLLNVSATEFIRNERLKVAVELMKAGNKNVSEIAYTVGFNDVSYFSKSFKDLYNLTPTEYLSKV